MYDSFETIFVICLMFFFQLVVTNEGLEAKIRHLNEDSEDEIAKGLREDIKILQSSTKQLDSEKKALLDQNQVLQKE